jgi:integrase
MKQHVFKRSRLVDGKRIFAKTYTGRFRIAGDLKDTEVPLDLKDKQSAQSQLAAIVKQAEMERHGLAAPLQQIQTVSMPLKSVVREWIADLTAKGRKPHYCGIMEKFMGVLMRDCGWVKVGDIRTESFIRWRGANQSKAAKTLNEYHGCARAFLNWLVLAGRLPANPLASLQKVETRGREVRNRRALLHDEFLAMLGVSGPHRSVVYAVAYYTGLRRSEIVSLCWGDFDLEGDCPTVTIHAKHAKNKKSVRLPLHLDLRGMLVSYFLACDSPGASVKALKVPHRLDAFNRDLKAAGIAKKDERGMIVDFHSLRHSTATRLASENVPLPVAMQIMRHSDPRLTAKAYVDQSALPLAASMALMPGMPNGKQLSPETSLDLVPEGHLESQAVASKPHETTPQASINELLSRLLSQFVAMGKMAPAVGIEPTTYFPAAPRA